MSWRRILRIGALVLGLTACSDGDRETRTAASGGETEAPALLPGLTRADGPGPYADIVRHFAFASAATRPDSYAFVSSAPVGFPSGRIVAADGVMLLKGTPAFTRTVPAGRFPVDLLLGRFRVAGQPYEEVLLAGILFSAGPVARWVGATSAGAQSEDDIDAVPCYPVDSGTGGLFDAEAFRLFGDHYYRGGRAGDELIAHLMDGRPVTALEGRAGGGALFASGGGDGCYASFFGLDAGGQVVTLITDFTGELRLPPGSGVAVL